MSTPQIRIPITRPAVGREEADAAAEAIMSGALAQGPRVAEFERRFAELVGVKHAIAIHSNKERRTTRMQEFWPLGGVTQD